MKLMRFLGFVLIVTGLAACGTPSQTAPEKEEMPAPEQEVFIQDFESGEAEMTAPEDPEAGSVESEATEEGHGGEIEEPDVG